MKWYEPKNWTFRNNQKRRNKNQKNGKHPSLVVGENATQFANFGLTHSSKRGHHKNIKLSENPNKKDNKPSYVRDDLQLDDKKYLKEILNYKKLSKQDIDKIIRIINKKDSH